MGYGGPQDNSRMRPGDRQSWASEPISVNDRGGRDGIGQGMDSPASPWEAPQPLASTTAGGQHSGRGIDREQTGELGTEYSMYPLLGPRLLLLETPGVGMMSAGDTV